MAANKNKINGILLKIAIALILILVIMGAFHANCELKQVNVTGTSIYNEQELWKMTSAGPLDVYAPFYAMTVSRNKGKGIPFIEKIEAKLTAPDTVELTVYEKKIIGCVYAMGGYFYFDRDGLVTEYSEQRLEEIPVVKGLDFSSIVVGKKLDVSKKKYFEQVLSIGLLVNSNEIAAQSIEFLYDDAVVIEVGETTVKAGKRSDYDVVINALPDILAALENRLVVLNMENYSESNTTVIAKPKN